MKVTLAAVISVDGKLTRQDETDISPWVSKEDHEHFVGLVEANQVIVMGSGTYRVMKDVLQLAPGKLRVVLTSRPGEYAKEAVDGQLEFRNESPQAFIRNLKSRGIDSVLVAGGEKMITDFITAGLIDEIYLTIEPRIFGSGKPLISAIPMDVKLQLLEQATMNTGGTLLLKYKVLKA